MIYVTRGHRFGVRFTDYGQMGIQGLVCERSRGSEQGFAEQEKITKQMARVNADLSLQICVIRVQYYNVRKIRDATH